MISTEEAESRKVDPLIVESSIISNIEKSTDDDNDDLAFPSDDDIEDMVKDVNLDVPLPNVTERYFTTYYRVNFPKKGDDICIRMHTNRLCMISLAPSHAIFQNERKISDINFQVTDKLNRADNPVSGKAKHGAQPLHETSKICSITCTNGETWTIRCGMNGKLTEANTDLLKNPELVREPPHKGGYLAIVLPKINAIDKLKTQLMTQEMYESAMRDRTNSTNGNPLSRTNGGVKRTRDDDNETEECREKIMRNNTIENAASVVDEKIESSNLPCT